MLLREWCYYSKNDITSVLSDGTRKNSRLLLPFLDESNNSYLRVRVNLRILLNYSHTILDVGQQMWVCGVDRGNKKPFVV